MTEQKEEFDPIVESHEAVHQNLAKEHKVYKARKHDVKQFGLVPKRRTVESYLTTETRKRLADEVKYHARAYQKVFLIKFQIEFISWNTHRLLTKWQSCVTVI